MPSDPPNPAPITYADTGVDYDRLDAFKVACQQAAATTVGELDRHGLAEAAGTRGESGYLMEWADGSYLAHVEEGLGTKNLIADAVGHATGDWSHYEAIGIDTIATAVNDLVTTGALPYSFAAHVGVGDAAWFDVEERAQALARGFAAGCRMSGCVWGGGETPALAGIIEPGAAVLAGSVVGGMAAGRRVAGDVQAGDRIVFLASNGVQTNGLSLCRRIGERIGFDADIGDGTAFGPALLAPSRIYADFVRELTARDLTARYLVHVTGHGWRKLMRLEADLGYVINTPHHPGTVPPLFEFLMAAGPIERAEAYATFNMGVGFAAYVRPSDAEATVAAAAACGHDAWLAGEVVAGPKRIEVPSLRLRFGAGSLNVR